MDGAPSKIHLTSKAYLKGWAPDGWLRPVDRQYGRQKPKHPAAVAWRRDWWGAENPELNAACEEACGQLETRTPDLLRRLQESWPLALEDRGVLAQLMALHVVRTLGFEEWFRMTRERSLTEYRDRFDSRAAWDRFRTVMRSDRERAKRVFGLINKMGTLIGSMHWTLVTFEEPLLVTSDQPVAPVPLLDVGEQEEVSAMPERGWAETVEVRFPVSPHEALLGTWCIRPEGAPHPGSWQEAIGINGVTRAQARRYYQCMEREPALPPPIFVHPEERFEPIGPAIIPGYCTAAARSCDLRLRAQKEVYRLIDAEDDSTLTLITPEFQAAA